IKDLRSYGFSVRSCSRWQKSKTSLTSFRRYWPPPAVPPTAALIPWSEKTHEHNTVNRSFEPARTTTLGEPGRFPAVGGDLLCDRSSPVNICVSRGHLGKRPIDVVCQSSHARDVDRFPRSHPRPAPQEPAFERNRWDHHRRDEFHELQPLPGSASIASRASGNAKRRRTLAIRHSRYTPLAEDRMRSPRAHGRHVLHAIFVRPHFFPQGLPYPQYETPPENLVGIRFDGGGLGLYSRCSHHHGDLEVLFMALCGAGIRGCEHAELAQICRTRRLNRLDGKWLYPKHHC